MDKAAYRKLILNALYGKHKNFPDDKLNECIKEFENNVRELEEELACKKQTLNDLRTERKRRNINNKFGLKIGEIYKHTYADTDSIYYSPKRVEEIENSVVTLNPHCKSCIYYDKLLNVCFVNNPDWKPVWDEREACEKWDNKILE